VLANVNKVFADNKLNITAQYLMTNSQIGYVITDISGEYDKEMLKAMKSIQHTIQLRFLY
jgi:D-3-phosphoglycerate dehydrogenase